MTLGNLAAFFQTSVKRLLAYSTISQAGYLLMAIAAARSALATRALLFYLAAYAVTNLGAFAVVTELPQATTLDSYPGLARRHPGLAAVLVVCLLGLVGTPPTAVFLGKLEIFTATIDGGYAWLAALAIANTVASLFYYLRWLAPAFLRAPAATQPGPLHATGRWAAGVAYTAGTASLALGVAAGAILRSLTGVLLRLTASIRLPDNDSASGGGSGSYCFPGNAPDHRIRRIASVTRSGNAQYELSRQSDQRHRCKLRLDPGTL